MEEQEKKVKFIAKAYHEVNRVLKQEAGEEGQLWEHSDLEEREKLIARVEARLKNGPETFDEQNATELEKKQYQIFNGIVSVMSGERPSVMESNQNSGSGE